MRIVLVALIHTKSCSILIGKLDLSLAVLVVAALRHGVDATLLDALAQIRTNVLSRVEHLVLLLDATVLGLNVREAVSIDQHVRVMLLLLHQADGRVASFANNLAVRGAGTTHHALIQFRLLSGGDSMRAL